MADRRDDGDNQGWSWWQYGAAAVGAASLVGGAYYLAQSSTEEKKKDKMAQSRLGMGEMLQSLNETYLQTVPQSRVPLNPRITNLNSLLADIYVRYIALKEDDFRLHYKVFWEIFSKIHSTMKEVDKYYQRYSSNVQITGSHSDRLRIKKPDEFDVDVVIGLPVNFCTDPLNPKESDIVIEPYYPGFVQLRAGVQYQNILIRDGTDCCINRAAHEWMDSKNYILRSKFTNWFKSVGTRALNRFPKINGTPVCYVNGVPYMIHTSESGPALTLKITSRNFKLDVDLVPCLRFPENRWLQGRYRQIPTYCRRDYWLVVPKPNKGGNTQHDENRSWRLALQDQEKQLLKNTYQLRQTIRLMKKLRDAQQMHEIASYHIKSIFFSVILDERKDEHFWKTKDMATLFKYMVKKFYDALERKQILFLWHNQQNMIANVNQCLINEYKYKIQKLLKVLEDPSNYKEVAKFLLNNEEYQSYKRYL